MFLPEYRPELEAVIDQFVITIAWCSGGSAPSKLAAKPESSRQKHSVVSVP